MVDEKIYKLTNSDGSVILSSVPGEFGGYKPKRIYGRLDCASANRSLATYARSRVFFANEAAAIAAGFRPCAKCLPERYRVWKSGGTPKTKDYPCHRGPG